MSEQFPHILWEGTILANHSFARVNRCHCQNIHRWDIADLTLIPYEADQISAAPDSPLAALMTNDVRTKGLNLMDRAKRPYLWIRHTWPPKPKPPGRDKWVVMLPWEYSHLPVKYVEIMKGAHEIWTPSSFSRNALLRSGVDANIHVVPNGMDPKIYHVAESNSRAEQPLTFLYVGGTIYRKGIDILLDAYRAAFNKYDDVRLIIKDASNRTLYKGQTAEDMIQNHQEGEGNPPIRYIQEELSELELAKLYRSSDVFVSPYRGEGFSLPTLEAMACGTPAIVTAGGSTDDFVSSQSGWKIPASKNYIGRKVYGDPIKEEGWLLEPDKDVLAVLLRRAYENPEELAAKSACAAKEALKWTWRSATLNLLERVDVICSTATAPSANISSEGV